MAETIPEEPTVSNGNGATGPDSRSRLEDLTAQATAKYAIKDYRAAAELYSRATELQAEINGEMSTKNADLLYYYGRCLYHVALMSSDVLGSKVAGEQQEQTGKKPKDKAKAEPAASTSQSRVDEEAVAIVAQEKGGEQPLEPKDDVPNKPYFTFTGDENFDDSDDEDAEGEDDGGEGPAEEEDEFGNAFEVLDLARVLLQRKLEEELNGQEGKGKSVGDTESVKQLKERLADTHDLQAEISLEGEQFNNAIGDLKAALSLKQELFPQHSSLIAEAHYKLSLALEFSSVTQQKDENGDVDETKVAHVDEAMREEAAKEMEAAIESCKIRIEKEEAVLEEGTASKDDSGKFKVTRESIDDVKEMVKDMEQRVSIEIYPLNFQSE